MSALGAFFKRFAVKFIEVVGAGIATALSGYLLAHFSGYWSPRAGAPPVVQVAPSVSDVSVVPKSERGQPRVSSTAPASEPANAKLPARSSAKGNQTGNQTAAAHKPAAADNAVSESKPRETESVEAKSADAKSADAKSVEAQVRAALANVDASRSVPPDTAAQKPELPQAVPAVVAPAPATTATPAPAATVPPAAPPPQKPADTSSGATSVAAAPPAVEAPPQSQQEVPAEPIKLTPVEIKSLPVAAVEPAPAPAPEAAASIKKESQASARADVSEGSQDDKSLFGAIKKIPDFFRAAAPASDAEAPRPPRPVGDE
jgi:hypothetical protein